MDDIIRLLEERRRRYNDAIDRAIRALRETPAGDTETPRMAPRAPAPTNGRAAAHVVPGSTLDRAVAILRERGRLRIGEILAAMGLPPDKKPVVVSALERGIPRGIIRRPEPATYEATM